MRPFFNALCFLTIIPGQARASEKKDFTALMACFPLAGLAVGALLAGMGVLLTPLFPAVIAATIIVIAETAVTGGLHLDGLADTFDGLGGGRDPERRLAIMKDSRIGTMGALSLLSAFVLKIQLIAVLPDHARSLALLAMPLLGRWSMLIPLRFFAYARKEGTGKIFFESMTGTAFIVATAITAAAAALLMRNALFLILPAVAAAVYGWCVFVGRRLGGGITGDVLGATNELSEVCTLLLIYLCRSWL